MRSTVPLIVFVLAATLLVAPPPALAGPQTPAPPPQAPATSAPPSADGAQALKEEVERLRAEFEAVKQQYGSRLADLESRLAALEGGKTAVPAAAAPQGPPPAAPAAPAGAQPGAQGAPTEAPVPGGAAGAGGPTGALPGAGNPAVVCKGVNPDIAVIGDFLGAAGTNHVAPTPAFDMHEAELSLQAVVDPYARADFFLAVTPTGRIEIEEGYLTFTELPGGLLAKVGKMRASFGKANQMHNHTMPWVDRPLMTENLVGGEEGISDAGVSVSRLLPNRWLFLEATGEVYRGESDVFSAPSRGDVTYVGRLRGYQDIGEASNIDAGGSVAFGHNGAVPGSTTRLIGFDATFRYRPLRRAIYRRFLGRTEMVWSRRSELAGQPNAFGAYVSGEYQFARRWFGGVRLDYSDRALAPALTDKGASLVVTYWPSEFSQVRGQFRRTRYAEGVTANEFLFQFLFSIGAHGAHTF